MSKKKIESIHTRKTTPFITAMIDAFFEVYHWDFKDGLENLIEINQAIEDNKLSEFNILRESFGGKALTQSEFEIAKRNTQGREVANETIIETINIKLNK